jgi:hypothetical protein
MAVPALRVVEDREGGKKKAPNKVLVSSDGVKLEGAQDVIGAGGVIDVIDERGFVDGVKVARKCSKANVLGKAVEYIRVLKKRENRLKTEQSGLKSLVSGLVGGSALLREWEREWKEKFGGEEKDEVEGEIDPDVDDEDSEDEQEDAEEEGRKRKRGKTAAVLTVKKAEKKPVDPNAVVPEKRKRGRPRKIVPPAPVDHKIEAPATVQPDPAMASAPQQYLLATFALFSFFNSPLTTSPSTSPSHTHSGTVLNPPAVAAPVAWGMTEYIQMFHLLVSVVVLLSFASSWAGYGFGGRTFSSVLWRHLSKKEKKSRADWVKMGEERVLAGKHNVLQRLHLTNLRPSSQGQSKTYHYIHVSRYTITYPPGAVWAHRTYQLPPSLCMVPRVPSGDSQGSRQNLFGTQPPRKRRPKAEPHPTRKWS